MEEVKGSQKLIWGRTQTKIIVSTNIAESNITINGISVVIDSGKVKETVFNPKRKMTIIKTAYISKAQAFQRKFIAGRSQKGVCFRIYSLKEFENMKEVRQPEIMRTPPEISILRLLDLGIKIEQFTMLDKLDKELV